MTHFKQVKIVCTKDLSIVITPEVTLSFVLFITNFSQLLSRIRSPFTIKSLCPIKFSSLTVNTLYLNKQISVRKICILASLILYHYLCCNLIVSRLPFFVLLISFGRLRRKRCSISSLTLANCDLYLPKTSCSKLFKLNLDNKGNVKSLKRIS